MLTRFFQTFATLLFLPPSFSKHVRATNELDPVTIRSQAIQKNLAVFLERTEYTLGSEPVILDKSVEDTILSDIFSRSIPVDKKKATEIARLSAVIGHVSIFLIVNLREFSSRFSFAARV
jgi:hypothetical protein